MKYTGLIQLLRLCFAGLLLLCPGSCETEDPSDDIIDVETDAEGVIAFTSGRDGTNDDEVAIVQISTGNITRLTTSAGWDSTPAWK